jgi:hypothetical protein
MRLPAAIWRWIPVRVPGNRNGSFAFRTCSDIAAPALLYRRNGLKSQFISLLIACGTYQMLWFGALSVGFNMPFATLHHSPAYDALVFTGGIGEHAAGRPP